MIDRLVVRHTLRNRAFGATMARTNQIYDITLFGLVSQPACFVRKWWCGGEAVEHREMAVLPVAHPEKETHYIGLLPPWLLDVLLSAHFGLPYGCGKTESSSFL